MSDAMMGEIRMFAGNFAPRGWALCNGQLLSIGKYSALFSILGTTYGGDGRTTFALPDLRGRSPVHAGGGPGVPHWALGQEGGRPQHELPGIVSEPHVHEVVITAPETKKHEEPATQAVTSSASGATMTVPANARTIPTVPPSLAIHFIIALDGLYPTRS